RVSALTADSGHNRDERGTSSQIAGHPILDNKQEQNRGDSGEQNRQVGIKTHNDGEHERRAEHGNDVLRTDSYGASPTHALMRSNCLPGRRCLTSMDFFATEHGRHELLLEICRAPWPEPSAASHMYSPASVDKQL